jgi:hypothetical protein
VVSSPMDANAAKVRRTRGRGRPPRSMDRSGPTAWRRSYCLTITLGPRGSNR